MSTLVLGLHPWLDRDRFLRGPEIGFREPLAFFREGVMRCFSPNLSTIAVATCLRDQGHEVELIDLALEFGIPFTEERRRERDHRLRRFLARRSYEQVFISAVSAGEHLTLASVAALIRDTLPRAKIGVGSYHANTLREALLREIPELDFILLGDLEPVASELMHRLEKPDPSALASMENVLVRDAEPVAYKPRAGRAESRFDYSVCESYLHYYDCLAVIASKGCPFDCSFCQEKVVRRGYETRSPCDVFDEVERNYALYEAACGHRDVAYGFMEPLFGLDRRWLTSFVDELERRSPRFPWGFQTRVGSFSQEQLARMAGLGLSIVYYGLESFSPTMLLRMRKTRTPAEYLRSFDDDLRACAASGILMEVNVLFGHPGETRATLDESRRGLAAAIAARPDLSLNLNLFRPLPGTESFPDEDAERLLVPEWWKAGALAGTAVLVQPSDALEPQELVEFYAELYSDGRGYERRGLGADLLRCFDAGEVPTSALPALGESIRSRVMRAFKNPLFA